MEVPNGVPGAPPASSSLKGLFDELRALHQQRLHRLDALQGQDQGQDQACGPEAALKMRVRLLQAYVIDLSDQNEILIQTVEELENQTVLQMTAVEAEFQLDDQEQRVCKPQSKQREAPAEWKQGCSRVPHLERLLEASEHQEAESHQQLAGKEAEASSLWGKLQRLQDKARSLWESCGEWEKTMVEQTCLMQQLHHEETSLGQATAALLEQVQGEPCCCQQTCQADREQLQGKFQRLQQEPDICKVLSEDNLNNRQACEQTMEEQSLGLDPDPDLLIQQYQTLMDQLCYYKEVARKQESELSHQYEREQHLQEQLGQAECSSSILESSLDLYKKKYQASLGWAGELEGQLQRLQEEFACRGRGRRVAAHPSAFLPADSPPAQSCCPPPLLQAKEQEEAVLKLHAERLVLPNSKCQQASQAGDAAERQTPELWEAWEKLSLGRQLTSQCKQTLQEVQEQLAVSHIQILDQEEMVAAVQWDSAPRKVPCCCSSSSYESQMASAEALQQKLLQVEEESSKHQQQAAEYQSLAQDLKLELVRVSEQKASTLNDVARLERRVQSLHQEVAADQERQQLEVAVLEQRARQLEQELWKSRECCEQREQAIRKRDALLRKSQAEMVCAHNALQKKRRELEQQQAQAHHLEASLQQAQHELERSRAECGTLRMEGQVLRQGLHESQQWHQQAAQALVQQEEQALLSQSSLHTAQEQLAERIAEVMHHTQAGRQLETEHKLLRERLSRAEAQLEQKREMLEQQVERLSQTEQQLQKAQQEAQRHQQVATRLELDVADSQEGLSSLQQQVQECKSALEVLHAELSQQQQREEDLQKRLHRATEQESRLAQEGTDLQQQLQSNKSRLQEEERRGQGLQFCLAEREAEKRALREALKEQATELQRRQSSLEHAQLQLQQQAMEALRQEALMSRLHTELHEVRQRERHSGRALAAAQELQGQAASCQASQRELVEQLEQRTQELSHLQAELQQAQQKVAHLEGELAYSQEQACTAHGQLGKLGGQARHWQKEQQAAKLALAEKDEELVVAKVELASLEEKCHSMMEEKDELQNEVKLLRQKCVVSCQEVESLQTSLEAERSNSHRLHHESELVVANITQWVKEQKQVNEKLGNKIRDQIKQIAQLAGETDYLHGLTEGFRHENKRLKAEVDERRVECERLKALCSSDLDLCNALRQPWPTLPANDSLFLAQRRRKENPP